MIGWAARLRPNQLVRDITTHRGVLDGHSATLNTNIHRHMYDAHRKLDALDRLRESVGYKSTLARGYAVIRADGAVASNTKAVKSARRLSVEMHDGVVDLGKGPAPRPIKRPDDDPQQGQLF